jgi:hypothetical protein
VAVESREHWAISADAEGNVLVWDMGEPAHAEGNKGVCDMHQSALEEQEEQEGGQGGGGESEEGQLSVSGQQLSELPELRVDGAAEEKERAPQGARKGGGRGGRRGWRGLMRLAGASREEMAVERANVGARCVFALPRAHKGGGMSVALNVSQDYTLAASAGRDATLWVFLGAHVEHGPSIHTSSPSTTPRPPTSALSQPPPSSQPPAATDQHGGGVERGGKSEWVCKIADSGEAGKGKRYAPLCLALSRDLSGPRWWLAVGEAAGGVSVYLVSVRPQV